MTPAPLPARRGPKPRPAVEHEHRWQPLGVTEIVGSVAFEMDRCTLRGCGCRRARRPAEEAEERSG